MKHLLPLTLALLASSLLYCQKKTDIPAFGKVEKADFDMKECDFDKNAEAVVLFDVAEMQCSISTYSVGSFFNRHVRIKLLNDKSLEQANIRIPYFAFRGEEDISNINAQTYNMDASGNIIVSKLEKKAIYNKEINKKISEKIFSFPEVRAGSIIEYTYTMKGGVESGLRNWYFQSTIPVKLSRYTIKFPPEIEVLSRPVTTLPVDVKRDNTGNYPAQIFTMTNIPALRDEPYISCKDDYLQRIESKPMALNTPLRRISLLRSWPGIISDLMEDEDFGAQLTKNIRRTDDLEEIVSKLKDPYAKMIAIYRYVRKNMEWNGQTSIWALNGVKSAWKEKKGTSGEINLILVNLLKDADLDAHPILVSTRDNGKINTLEPGYGQFDKVLAYIKINDKTYVLDATDKYASPNLIPWEVMDSEGLLIEKFDTHQWGWRTLWDDQQTFRDDIYVNASVNEQGNMTGNVTVKSYDYSRSKRLPKLKSGKEKFIEEYFTAPNLNVHIDSFSTENEEIDTMPLIQRFQFNQSLNASGGYKYFSINPFSGLEKNPFVSDTRFSDIFFGANQRYTMVGTYSIPDGYSFDELPKNLRMLMPDTSVVFTRILETDEGRLYTRITLEFRRPQFSVEDYDYFREFYKKLYDYLSEQIVIKKKTSTAP